MATVLIVYATKNGHTAKIASQIQLELKRLGHAAHVADARTTPERLLPEDYDGVIVGAPVYGGSYPRPIRRWVSKYARVLERKPGAFFSVSLSILERGVSEPLRDERRGVERFSDFTGWYPQLWKSFSGALSYTRYNWFIKWVMRRAARRAGMDTDSSKDYEYTDWNEVRAFVRDFDGVIRGAVRRAA